MTSRRASKRAGRALRERDLGSPRPELPGPPTAPGKSPRRGHDLPPPRRPAVGDPRLLSRCAAAAAAGRGAGVRGLAGAPRAPPPGRQRSCAAGCWSGDLPAPAAAPRLFCGCGPAVASLRLWRAGVCWSPGAWMFSLRLSLSCPSLFSPLPFPFSFSLSILTKSCGWPTVCPGQY